jgi:hypothetical protein
MESQKNYLTAPLVSLSTVSIHVVVPPTIVQDWHLNDITLPNEQLNSSLGEVELRLVSVT